jgi:hypothetical protein
LKAKFLKETGEMAEQGFFVRFTDEDGVLRDIPCADFREVVVRSAQLTTRGLAWTAYAPVDSGTPVERREISVLGDGAEVVPTIVESEGEAEVEAALLVEVENAAGPAINEGGGPAEGDPEEPGDPA